jgi:hypothetical protein
MNNELNPNWKEFKGELHKAIEKHGAGNIKIVSGEFICAEADGSEVTKRYKPDILSQREIGIWTNTLGLL